MAIRPIRSLFLPLTGRLARKHALVLTICGVVLTSAGAVLWFVI